MLMVNVTPSKADGYGTMEDLHTRQVRCMNSLMVQDSYVSVTIYDMLGNVINHLISTNQSSGFKSVQWDATNNQGQSVSAGVYFYTIQVGDYRQTKKMILLK